MIRIFCDRCKGNCSDKFRILRVSTPSEVAWVGKDQIIEASDYYMDGVENVLNEMHTLYLCPKCYDRVYHFVKNNEWDGE